MGTARAQPVVAVNVRMGTVRVQAVVKAKARIVTLMVMMAVIKCVILIFCLYPALHHCLDSHCLHPDLDSVLKVHFSYFATEFCVGNLY